MLEGLDRIQDHRFAQEWQKHLVLGSTHAGPLTRAEDDRNSASSSGRPPTAMLWCRQTVHLRRLRESSRRAYDIGIKSLQYNSFQEYTRYNLSRRGWRLPEGKDHGEEVVRVSDDTMTRTPGTYG